MKNLKLNKLNQISDELKNAVRGGGVFVCSCGCCGEASVASNRSTNAAEHKTTKCDKEVAYEIVVTPDD